MIPKESKCVNGWLHNFKIFEQTEEGVHEVCEQCGQRKHFRVAYDKVDNENYLKYHIRQALTPNHPSFYREYFYMNEELNKFYD